MSSAQSDTRSRILETTANLLLERYGSGVSMQEIAEATGISRQAVYLHFPTRAELMIAAVRYLDGIYGLDDEVRRFREAQTGPEILDAFVEFWGNYVPKIYGVAKALMALRDVDDAAAATWKDRMDSVKNGCRRTIETIEYEGLLSPEWTVDEAVDLMWTALSIESWEKLTIESGWSREAYITRLQIALRGLFLSDIRT